MEYPKPLLADIVPHPVPVNIEAFDMHYSSPRQRMHTILQDPNDHSHYSWLGTGVVPPFFDQGETDTCWSIPPILATQSFWSIYGDIDASEKLFPATIDNVTIPRELKLSPQAAIDGIPSVLKFPTEARKVFRKPDTNIFFSEWNEVNGSYGSHPLCSLEYSKYFGIPYLKQYKYNGRFGKIKSFCPVLRPAKFQVVDICNVRNAINRSPIVGDLEFFRDFYGYSEGLYEGVCRNYKGKPEEPVQHSVLVTGYGGDRNSDSDYLEIQNSWIEWGINNTSVAKVTPRRFTRFHEITSCALMCKKKPSK